MVASLGELLNLLPMSSVSLTGGVKEGISKLSEWRDYETIIGCSLMNE